MSSPITMDDNDFGRLAWFDSSGWWSGSFPGPTGRLPLKYGDRDPSDAPPAITEPARASLGLLRARGDLFREMAEGAVQRAVQGPQEPALVEIAVYTDGGMWLDFAVGQATACLAIGPDGSLVETILIDKPGRSGP